MSIFSRHTETTETADVLASFFLTDQEAQQPTSQDQIPSHCGWCEPYIEGATTGICSACEEQYFPKKKR